MLELVKDFDYLQKNLEGLSLVKLDPMIQEIMSVVTMLLQQILKQHCQIFYLKVQKQTLVFSLM